MTSPPEPPFPETDPHTPDPGEGEAWAPFDPGEAPGLPATPDGGARVVAIVASAELVGAGWATSVATTLARTWTEGGARVVLVDTSLARPRLHHAVGASNATGLADILTGTATVDEATHVVEPGRLFCVPAGNAPEDPADGFHRERWSRFCGAFAEAGVTVVAYVPGDAPWRSAVLEGATHIVELRERHGSRGWVAPPGVSILAVLGPMPRARPSSPGPAGQEPATSVPLLAFPTTTGEPEDPPTREPDDRPPRARKRRPRSRTPAATASRDAFWTGSRGRAPVLLTLGVVAMAAVAWLSTRPDPGSSAPDTSGVAAGVSASAEPAGSIGFSNDERSSGTERGPRPIDPGADFSVALAAYRDTGRAEAHRNELAGLVPDVPTFVAPVEVDGVVYHRVLAGLAPDSASAAALAAELASIVGGDPTSWVVRGTDLVFDLGGAPTREVATRKLSDIVDRGVPATLAHVTYTDRSARYRIYAGGYANRDEAAHLGRLIASAGLEAELTTRLGLPARETTGPSRR